MGDRRMRMVFRLTRNSSFSLFMRSYNPATSLYLLFSLLTHSLLDTSVPKMQRNLNLNILHRQSISLSLI